MRALLYCLGYLFLKDSQNRRILWRDFVPVAALTVTLAAPFLMLAEANFFTKDGFLDHVRALAVSLTGFYVAALVLAATFEPRNGATALDELIEGGRIRLWDPEAAEDHPLKRREYLRLMYGYLAFVSMVLSIGASLAVAVSLPVAQLLQPRPIISGVLSVVFLVGFLLVVSHLAITTARGLWYMIDRIYDQAPRLKKKSETPSVHDEPR